MGGADAVLYVHVHNRLTGTGPGLTNIGGQFRGRKIQKLKSTWRLNAFAGRRYYARAVGFLSIQTAVMGRMRNGAPECSGHVEC